MAPATEHADAATAKAPEAPRAPAAAPAPAPDPRAQALEAALDEVRHMVAGCMQCGTCSASCPNQFAMDLTPRRMWRLLLHGYADEVMDSKTFYLCSSCYGCTLRCPRGLPLTRAMAALKRASILRGGPGQRRHGAFYATFVDNVRRLGRVNETDLMAHYFVALRDPLAPFSFMPLGLRMLAKGKAGLHGSPQRGRLGPLFAKVREMEEKP
ncbi:MAG: 4Fe-4S dicluster domain-containing protein [Desulfovibrionaceae bacterium]|jgi:heterodisulfide reductase subunit C|nr:4Fe-4S dicluster domain-containing protein [Desulfovibrionaceae bacterium]